MSLNRIFCGALFALAVAVGCSKKSEPPVIDVPNVQIAPPGGPPPAILPAGPAVAPMPRVAPVITWVPGTKEEQAAFIAHIPEPIRKLYASDFQVFTDLEGKAFAWEYTGGPVKLWLEFEESGQSTVPKRYPEKDEWLVKGETGRVIFWVRRGVSDKVNTVLKRAGQKEGDTSAVGVGVTATSSDGGLNTAVGYKNPLWYGWGGYTFESERPWDEVKIPADAPATALVLEAKETNVADGKQPRRAKLVLKVQRVKPE